MATTGLYEVVSVQQDGGRQVWSRHRSHEAAKKAALAYARSNQSHAAHMPYEVRHDGAVLGAAVAGRYDAR